MGHVVTLLSMLGRYPWIPCADVDDVVRWSFTVYSFESAFLCIMIWVHPVSNPGRSTNITAPLPRQALTAHWGPVGIQTHCDCPMVDRTPFSVFEYRGIWTQILEEIYLLYNVPVTLGYHQSRDYGPVQAKASFKMSASGGIASNIPASHSTTKGQHE